MGCKSSKLDRPAASSSSSPSTPVTLNVYDLTLLNRYTYWFGFGIFHSGIEVYGMEYGFGAHDYPTTGVFEVEPKQCPGFSYRCSIPLGNTSMLPLEFREFIENMGAEYMGDSYHLISKNCNHFAADMSLKLTGMSIPRWVNRMAHLCALCCCTLPKTLRVEAVKGEPPYHGLHNDDSAGSFSIISSVTPTESDSSDHDKCHFDASPDSQTALIEDDCKP